MVGIAQGVEATDSPSKPEVTDSAEVTTVALLARRSGMSADLFSAYWRDVHGVLAARIPGFWSYVQNHLEVLDGTTEAIDGFAEVCYASKADRQGLISSEITTQIQRDESNVFSRTLLYNLEAGESATIVRGDAPIGKEPKASFVIVLQSAVGVSAAGVESDLRSKMLPLLRSDQRLRALRVHRLASGDASQWNVVAGVDNREREARNSVIVQASWSSTTAGVVALSALRRSLPPSFLAAQAYRVYARYEMVAHGAPTLLGLRGLSVVQTIEAAGASNQKEPALLRCLYG